MKVAVNVINTNIILMKCGLCGQELSVGCVHKKGTHNGNQIHESKHGSLIFVVERGSKNSHRKLFYFLNYMNVVIENNNFFFRTIKFLESHIQLNKSIRSF